MASAERITRAALLVTAAVLMQCCNAALAARLLEGDGGWLRRGAGSLIMEVLPRCRQLVLERSQTPPVVGELPRLAASNLAVADIDMLV
ncbi:hypothetical protein CFC21_062834 [Triticum aestivum]|uniref:Uncharacterized protein n=2 Tax=Triticum aestivum TaxID=4565 RepID=A0A3B6JLA6_WHEAT|nr:hypothetical protein CFC21_062834 [Triticum aestivum]